MEDVINTYVSELLKKADINLPEGLKQEYTDKLSAEVQQRLGMMALSELDAEGLKKFEEIMRIEETPDQKKLLEFFNTEISGFQDKVNRSLGQFSEEFLNNAAKLKELRVS